MIQRANTTPTTIGLMLSGGVDSAILLVELLMNGHRVQPFYVSTGCQWETEERLAIDRLLHGLANLETLPVVDLTMPIEDLYGEHWSLTGIAVPDETTPDEAVFLPARNPLLLLKPALWCAQHGIEQLALATLADNPFSDATPQFCSLFESLIGATTGATVEIIQPFASYPKREILRRATDFPYQLTFSCLAPDNGQHCGCCNKCAERKVALQTLTCGDLTEYASAVSTATR